MPSTFGTIAGGRYPPFRRVVSRYPIVRRRLERASSAERMPPPEHRASRIILDGERTERHRYGQIPGPAWHLSDDAATVPTEPVGSADIDQPRELVYALTIRPRHGADY